MVGGVSLETSASHEFPALVLCLTPVLRLTPGLVTALIRSLVGHKFVVHHLLSPRPVKQRDRETVLNRVLPGQFRGSPAGLLARQQPRGRIERRPVGANPPRTAPRHLHRVGAPEPLHAARLAPGSEVGSVTVHYRGHEGRYGSSISLERGEKQIPGRRERSERSEWSKVAAIGFLLGTAIGRGPSV